MSLIPHLLGIRANSTAVHRHFGFEGMEIHAKHVEECLHDAQILCDGVED